MKNLKLRGILLLLLIYVSFISLGLPDGVLGIAWPFLRLELGLPLEAMGPINAALLLMSAASSFCSGWVLKRFGTGTVTFLSCAVTGLALLGVSASTGLPWLFACIIPLGFGQGAVDSGLNQYVADHYAARHMNWLHCFWGVGASMGPAVMTAALLSSGWRQGYRLISLLQMCLSAILLVSLAAGLWKISDSAKKGQQEEALPQGRLGGTGDQLLAAGLFFLYVGAEATVGSWLGSMLVENRGLAVSTAGLCVTVFYAGIMTGRLLSGFLVGRLGCQRMIRLGLALALVGAALAGFGTSGATAGFGAALIGMGFAPAYPCLMHLTPRRFTREATNRLVGIQVGSACLGGSIVCTGAGLLFSQLSLNLLFPLAGLLVLALLAGNEILEKRSHP